MYIIKKVEIRPNPVKDSKGDFLPYIFSHYEIHVPIDSGTCYSSERAYPKEFKTLEQATQMVNILAGGNYFKLDQD